MAQSSGRYAPTRKPQLYTRRAGRDACTIFSIVWPPTRIQISSRISELKRNFCYHVTNVLPLLRPVFCRQSGQLTRGKVSHHMPPRGGDRSCDTPDKRHLDLFLDHLMIFDISSGMSIIILLIQVVGRKYISPMCLSGPSHPPPSTPATL